jgi:hypothetical protein
MKRLIAAILASSLGLAIQKPVKASPIQCYVGQGEAYQVCDFKEIEPSTYLLTWSDGEKTAIIETKTPSGSWAKVAHARADGSVYAAGARYPRIHYEKGEWLCYHFQPGGLGDIDFCITP